MVGLSSLPVIVGFPRSGNHWIQALLESYFNKRRYNQSEIIFCDSSVNEYIFYGSHDLNCNELFTGNTTIYLYRNPVDVMYSYYSAKIKEPGWYRTQDDFLGAYLPRIKIHYLKYLGNVNVDFFLYYDSLVLNFFKVFEKLVTVLNGTFNYKKAKEVNNKLSKEKLIRSVVKQSSSGIGSPYINYGMMTQEYVLNRIGFRNKYGNNIERYIFDDNINLLKFFPLGVFYANK